VPAPKSSFYEKVLGRIGRLDKEGLQTVVQRLARERSFLETLFNTIEDGVMVVDENGRVIYLNQAASRLLALPADSTEGRPIAQMLPDLDWEKLLSADQRGGSRLTRHEFELQYPRPSFISLYAAPLDGDAVGSSGVALILHDATEARQRTNEAIESERIQALTLLAASVAHEIGNPLNALHIHLQLMEREIARLRPSPPTARPPSNPGSPGRRKAAAEASSPGDASAEVTERVDKLERYLDVCKGEISRLDYTVTQFLQAIRPSIPQLRHVSVNDVVREAVDLLRPEIENRGIIIHEKLARQLPPSPIDPAQIKQVLVNLMKNAIQAMTRDGRLTLETTVSGDGVVLSVGDTGGGIPPEQLSRIYEPFFTTKKKGSGLGLMIVRRIVRDHNGQLNVESHVGKGTVFRIWLPFLEKQTRLIPARHD
jgi:two-component system, sporulation sensor kinase E